MAHCIKILFFQTGLDLRLIFTISLSTRIEEQLMDSWSMLRFARNDNGGKYKVWLSRKKVWNYKFVISNICEWSSKISVLWQISPFGRDDMSQLIILVPFKN